MTDNGVYNYLDCSTAHITEEDDKFLDNECREFIQSILIVQQNDEGYWLPAVEPLEFHGLFRKKLISRNIFEIFQKAYEMGCMWIKLDRDGFIHNDLSKYNW